DPVLTLSSYLGGNFNDVAAGVAVDASGYVYLAGSTNSFDFPVSHHGTYCRPTDDPNQVPCINAFAIKLDPSGTNFVYATYFVVGDGGAHAIAVDSAGNAYLTGNTDTGSDAGVASSAFIAKLNPSGSQLLYYKLINLPVTPTRNPFHTSGEAVV